MRQIILEIPDNKFQFVIDLLSHFKFIRFKKKNLPAPTDHDVQFVKGLKSALDEVELHLQGKKKLKKGKDFLNEI